MIRKINRQIKDFLRPLRFYIGRLFWDRKKYKPQTNNSLATLLHNQEINKILLLRIDGKIGDSIISTILFKNLKKMYPHLKIDVSARGETKNIFIHNPYINAIIADNDFKSIKGEYDLLITMSEVIKVKEMKFISKAKAKYNLAFNHEDWNLFDFNINYNFKEKHIKYLYATLLEKLGAPVIDINYDLYLPEKVNSYLGSELKDDLFKVVINPFAASKHRSFNLGTLELTLRALNELPFQIQAILIYPPDKKNLLITYVKNLGDGLKEGINITIPKTESLFDTMIIMKECDFFISPDTSIVHMGVAYNKPGFTLYNHTSNPYSHNTTVWGPGSVDVRQYLIEQTPGSQNNYSINTFEKIDFKEKLLETIKRLEEN